MSAQGADDLLLGSSQFNLRSILHENHRLVLLTFCFFARREEFGTLIGAHQH